MMLLLELFGRFFLVGLFSVGGGLATLPFLTDMSQATGWFTSSDIADMVAVSESTPGPLGVNMATYVGYTTAGIPGSLIAAIGLVAPSVIVIIIVSRILMKFRDSKLVNNAFYALRAASLGLIAAACYAVAKLVVVKSEVLAETGSIIAAIDYKSIILCVLIFVCVRLFKRVHPIVFIVAAAVIGIIFKM